MRGLADASEHKQSVVCLATSLAVRSSVRPVIGVESRTMTCVKMSRVHDSAICFFFWPAFKFQQRGPRLTFADPYRRRQRGRMHARDEAMHMSKRHVRLMTRPQGSQQRSQRRPMNPIGPKTPPRRYHLPTVDRHL